MQQLGMALLDVGNGPAAPKLFYSFPVRAICRAESYLHWCD
jgi:hypothetical protein